MRRENLIKLACREREEKARFILRQMSEGEKVTFLIGREEKCLNSMKRLCLFLDHTLLNYQRLDTHFEVTIQKGLMVKEA